MFIPLPTRTASPGSMAPGDNVGFQWLRAPEGETATPGGRTSIDSSFAQNLPIIPAKPREFRSTDTGPGGPSASLPLIRRRAFIQVRHPVTGLRRPIPDGARRCGFRAALEMTRAARPGGLDHPDGDRHRVAGPDPGPAGRRTGHSSAPAAEGTLLPSVSFDDTFEEPAFPPPTFDPASPPRVVMGPLEVMRESIFGPASPEDWKPLTLGTFFSEGWDEPFTALRRGPTAPPSRTGTRPPPESSGGTPPWTSTIPTPCSPSRACSCPPTPCS